MSSKRILGVSLYLATSSAASAQTPAQQVSSAATRAQDRTAFISAAEFGLVCDAVETSVTLNGVHKYSTVNANATDNTRAIANFVAALGVANGTGRMGAGGESNDTQIHQLRGVMPPGCSYALSSWPNFVPEAVDLEGNQSSGYITSPSGHGPYWDALVGKGTSNNTAHGFRLVYAGPIGQSKGDGITMLGGAFNKLRDNDIFGFRSGIALGGVEYTHVNGNNLAHNVMGIMALSATFANDGVTPSVFSASGTPSINNNFEDNTYRVNKVNLYCNGCTTSVFGVGSASFGTVAGIVLGALDFSYVESYTVTGGSTAVCTASSTIPLSYSDRNGTLLPEGIIKTDKKGHVIGAYSTNGGRVSSGITTIIPKSSSLGCTIPPTLTPHLASMADDLPFKGMSSANSSQNIITYQNIENEGADANGILWRPSSGYQVIADSSANDLYLVRPINGLGTGDPTGFAHFMLNMGTNTKILDPLVSALADPSTGATCPFVSTQKMKIIGDGYDQDNSGSICNTSYVADYTTPHGISGWDNGLLQAHGFRGYGFGQPTDTLLKGQVKGESSARSSVLVNGDLFAGPGGTFGFDVHLGRMGYTPIGEVYGLVQGISLCTPTLASSLGSGAGPLPTGTQYAPSFFTCFKSTNSKATNPNPGSLGIPGGPNGYVCTVGYNWNGGGSNLATWTYDATASCDGAQGEGHFIYQSFGRTIGKEQYALSSITANLAATQATAPSGTCYTPYQEVIARDGSHTFCGASGSQWKTTVPAPR